MNIYTVCAENGRFLTQAQVLVHGIRFGHGLADIVTKADVSGSTIVSTAWSR